MAFATNLVLREDCFIRIEGRGLGEIMLAVGFSGRDLGSMVTGLTKKHIIARMAVFGYLWVEDLSIFPGTPGSHWIYAFLVEDVREPSSRSGYVHQ